MKKLITLVLVLTVLISCKQQEKKETADNGFTITVTGKEHLPEDSHIGVFRMKTIESPDMIEILHKNLIGEEKFEYKGTVEDIHLVTVYVPRYATVTIPLEPGQTTINFAEQRAFTYKGGKYGDIVVNSWNDNKDYRKAQKELLDFKGDVKDSIQDKIYLGLEKKVFDTKYEILMEEFTKHKNDPLVQLLIMNSIGFNPDPKANVDPVKIDAIKEDLAKKVGVTHRQSLATMYVINKARKIKKAKATVKIGSIIKNFTAKNLKGKEFHLADVLQKNKYVLVEFWASWCNLVVQKYRI